MRRRWWHGCTDLPGESGLSMMKAIVQERYGSLDDLELRVDPLPQLLADGPVAPSGAVVDQLPEIAVQRLPRRRVEAGQVQLTEAQVELAGLGDLQGRVARLGQIGEDLPHLFG